MCLIRLAMCASPGYTIGYYGRPFEARNKPKGSSFSDENKEFYRFVVGGNTVIPAFQEAILGMKVREHTLFLPGECVVTAAGVCEVCERALARVDWRSGQPHSDPAHWCHAVEHRSQSLLHC